MRDVDVRPHESVRVGETPPVDTGRLVTGEVARELVDLLTVILGHASLLEAGLRESDDRRQDTAAIAAAARRAAHITSQLLAISRNAPARTKVENLSPPS